MKLKLSLAGFALLRYTLTFNGEKEFNLKGEELDTPRRLRGDEAIQRRNFIKEVSVIQDEASEKINPLVNAHNVKVSGKRAEIEKVNLKKEDENAVDYEKRINNLLNAEQELTDSLKELNQQLKDINEEEREITLVDKTLGVVKKYFKEYGDKVGFVVGDDATIEQIEEALK